MNFLKSRSHEVDAIVEGVIPKRKSKSDHNQAQEAEISAFFRPASPLAGHGRGSDLRRDRSQANDKSSKSARHLREPSLVSQAPIPTIEVPNNVPHAANRAENLEHQASDTYVSWSESIRPLSPARHENSSPRTHPRPLTRSAFEVERTRENKPRLEGQCIDQSPNEANRAFVPAGFSIAPTLGLSRSQSLPHCTSSPARLYQTVLEWKHNEAGVTRSSLRPSVTVAHGHGRVRAFDGDESRRANAHARSSVRSTSVVTMSPRCRAHSRPPIAIGSDVDFRANHEQKTTLQANDQWFRSQQSIPQTTRYGQDDHPWLEDDTREAVRLVSPGFHRHLPHVGWMEGGRHALIVQDLGPSIYEEQEHRLQRRSMITMAERIEEELYTEEQRLLESYHQTSSYHGQPVELLQEGLMRDCWEKMNQEQDLQVQRPDSRRERSGKEDSGHDVVVPGFWRPNRLY